MTAFWIIQAVRIVIGYLFVLYIWPSVVFRKILKGKGMTYRFTFCVTVQMTLLTTVVIMLGLVHLLNVWVVRALFWGVFAASLVPYIIDFWRDLNYIQYLLDRVMTPKMMIFRILKAVREKFVQSVKHLVRKFREHPLEYLLLTAVLLYGLCYFGYGIMQTHSYGASDMPVHHSWIYGLFQGKSYSAGIYPEAMHCFVYALSTLMGGQVYVYLILLQPVQNLVLFISIYLFCREVFNSRFTGIFVLIGFLMLRIYGGINAVFSIGRMQWLLPQEFGYYTIFLMAACFLRYCKAVKTGVRKNGKPRVFLWNSDLVFFSLALSVSIATHFYITIFAFFVMVPLALVQARYVFTKERFLPLAAAVLAALFIAALPMGIAHAEGTPLQGSLKWALNVMKPEQGEKTAEEADDAPSDKTLAELQEEVDANRQQIAEEWGIDIDALGPVDGSASQDAQGTPAQQTDKTETASGAVGKIQGIFLAVLEKGKHLWERVSGIVKQVYTRGFTSFYGEANADVLLVVTFLGFGLWAVYGLLGLLSFILKKDWGFRKFAFVPALHLILMIHVIETSPAAYSMPGLIETYRMFVFDHLYAVMILAIPVDYLFFLLQRIPGKQAERIGASAALIAAALYIGTSDQYHGALFNNLTAYNDAIDLAEDIIQKEDRKTYTIVATTNELYLVNDYGWHMEIIDLLKAQGKKKPLTIPTETVYLFREKNVLHYVQEQYAKLPRWLASDVYYTRTQGPNISAYPEVISKPTSEDLVWGEFTNMSKPSNVYAQIDNRVILESRFEAWINEFTRLYPDAISVYYENEDYVCYRIRQNAYALYEMNILKQ